MSAARTRVLVVEDEEAYVEGLVSGLSREGFDVDVAKTGLEAVQAFDASDPDVVLLDLMLPGMSGVDVCKHIRKTSMVPVIMLTAKDSEVDIVVGLEVGADDYIVKPYRLRELIARMRAVLRRTHDDVEVSDSDADPHEVIVIGDVQLDIARHSARVRGEEIALTIKEFDLLEVLMTNAGRALSRSSLIDNVWSAGDVGDTKTVDVHVMRLRNKIELDPARPTHITTIRGLGYRFEKNAEKAGS